MTRRDLFALLGRVSATAAGSAFVTSWVAAAHNADSPAPPDPGRFRDYSPQFFSPEEFRAVDEFTAIVIPTDETPGAREAFAAAFIDFLLANAGEYAPEMQTSWRDHTRWLMQAGFNDMQPEKQVEFVSKASAASAPHFEHMKELTVFAFYTSRAGVIGDLQYKGLAYLTEFPGCSHAEHQQL